MLTIDDRKQILKKAVNDILAFREKKRGGPKKRNRPFSWPFLADRIGMEEKHLEARVYGLNKNPAYGEASFNLTNKLAEVMGCPVRVKFESLESIKAEFTEVKDEILRTLELEKVTTKDGMTVLSKKYGRSREYLYSRMKKTGSWKHKELENFCVHFTSHPKFKFLRVTDAR